MKNFNFFLQNLLKGPKIFNLNNAAPYPPKPNPKELHGMAQNSKIPIKIGVGHP